MALPVHNRPALEALLREVLSRGLKYVGTRGDVSAPVCVMGEAPGADEESQGEPFVGPLGRMLDTMLSEAGFAIPDCWFTNVYKVRPPYNELDRLPELGIADKVFHDETLEELHSMRPTFIVAAGATPLGFLCPQTIDKKTSKAGITHWRGSLLTSPLLKWEHYVVPIYHPAFILREWGEKYFNTFLLERLKHEVEYWKHSKRLQPVPTRELVTEPSFDEAWEYLNDILHLSNGASAPTSVDIETLRRRFPYTISFAKSSSSSISIGLGDYLGSNGNRLWKLIDEILATRHVVGQNYINFDCHWLRACGFSVNVNFVDDTRIRHNVLWPEFSHKLEFMTTQYTREPYYKEEGKSWNRIAGSGKRQLMRYNCKDTCVTREIYDVQELELADRPALRRCYDNDIDLARKLHYVAYRGIKTNPEGLNALRKGVGEKLIEVCKHMETLAGAAIAFDAKEQALLPGSINIGAPAQLIKLLEGRGLKIPVDRFTRRKTTNEEKLHALFAESGDELLNDVLTVRELNKIKTTYVDVKLIDNTLYSDYVVGGTDTGRRSSKAFPLWIQGEKTQGFGCNGQNLPKHSKLGKQFRKALVARPGKIFLSCDQISAEDWIVQGTIADESGDESGIRDLRSGIDRHCKLAMFIFALPEEKCNKAAEKSGLIFRYVGKRTRHGGHYDMRGNKMSGVLSKEGFSVPAQHCDALLERFHLAEPNIRGVFHEYVKREITNTRRLRNLFGRERDFFGYCPWRDNGEVFRTGYAYIPQGTVGDNTGCAIRYGEHHDFGCVVSESHDSVTLEIDDNFDSIYFGVQLLTKAFNNKLRFPKGFELVIPIEFEIGYNMCDTFGLGDQINNCENLTKVGLKNSYDTFRQRQSPPMSIYTGAPSVQLQQA